MSEKFKDPYIPERYQGKIGVLRLVLDGAVVGIKIITRELVGAVMEAVGPREKPDHIIKLDIDEKR